MAAAIEVVMMNQRYSAQIDPELAGTDGLADRWSKFRDEAKGLHPLEAIRLMHDGAVLGGYSGMPDDVAAFDEIYSHPETPKVTRAFILMWYTDPAPVYVKANRLGVSRSTLYADLKGHLQYMRGRLHAKNIMV
jgi:hypothetical protein